MDNMDNMDSILIRDAQASTFILSISSILSILISKEGSVRPPSLKLHRDKRARHPSV